MTVAVTDINKSKKFFELLGFEVVHDLVIEKDPFSVFINIKDLKAQHVTMKIKGTDFEIQLLYLYSPTPQHDKHINRLDKIGYNHMCFNIDNLEKMTKYLQDNNVKILSGVLEFNNRKLVYLEGPDGIIIELAEWV